MGLKTQDLGRSSRISPVNAIPLECMAPCDLLCSSFLLSIFGIYLDNVDVISFDTMGFDFEPV